jgi:hypothetical protein
VRLLACLTWGFGIARLLCRSRLALGYSRAIEATARRNGLPLGLPHVSSFLSLPIVIIPEARPLCAIHKANGFL